MLATLRSSFSFWQSDKNQRNKILLLSIIFFFVIAAYTVVYDLKNSIFIGTVGKEYIPWAKMLSMFTLIPAVLFYSFLVDRLRRYQLLCFYAVVYGIFGLICAYLIGHPTIGLINTDSSPYRVFGWVFYFLVEGFSPFVVSVYWAFANSVSTPEDAKDNYGILVLGSKLGGMMSAGSAWMLLTLKDFSGHRIFLDAANHQILLYFFSTLVLLVPLFVYFFIKKVPGSYLHGYEAVYRFEKKEEDRPGIWTGLVMLMQRPYILGIFGMLFFYEVLNTILSYQRLSVAQSVSSNVSDLSYYLYQQMFAMHAVGFFISLFGTRTLLQILGERICLMLIPLSSGILLFLFWLSINIFGTASLYTQYILSAVFIVLKSINYAFATPIRESLYIPTIKTIKFKSKSWIDAFGSKMARSTGSSINLLAEKFGSFPVEGIVFFSIIVSWFATSILLGKRYDQAIKNNEIIS